MDLGLVVVRVVVGVLFAAHGGQKLYGWFGGGGLESTSAAFDRLGFRNGRLNALAAGWFELIGGLLLAVGLVMPLTGALVIGVMIVAGWTAHLSKGVMMNKGGVEYNLVLMAVAFGLVASGPGDVSLDAVLDWHLRGDGWALVALASAVVFATLHLALLWRRPAPVTTSA